MHAPDSSDSPLTAAASQWLARRDRGLTGAEQDEYLQWLRESPSHGAEIAALERAWKKLDALKDWRPAHSTRPNPDLLAPSPAGVAPAARSESAFRGQPARRSRRWIRVGVLSAAAALVLGTIVWHAMPRSTPPGVAVVQPGPQRLTLPDGSLVELNRDAQIAVQFSAAERDITLLRGEAHFIVAKNPARPFVVAANGFTVRAVGTAFDVQMRTDAVSVLVTEGRVQLNKAADAGLAARELSAVTIGQQATVRFGGTDVDLRTLSPTEIERALAWQTMRIEFSDLPLRDVVQQFNRYNHRKLILSDAATGDIRVGGSFRADNLDAFVRLLNLGFGVDAIGQGDNLLLRRHD